MASAVVTAVTVPSPTWMPETMYAPETDGVIEPVARVALPVVLFASPFSTSNGTEAAPLNA